ncbi:MAG: hypothetical protein O3C62_07375 [Actinomycetota bacterium]|jgi:uncharacterized integral membrane protein|nr:hypothetical protein [Actinomycetota bacterium]MDA3001486.1 hypothetical protein [Actinomycetota bacterium]MDA3024829.1 hypothetical protein [Actinomycetota bacterium]
MNEVGQEKPREIPWRLVGVAVVAVVIAVFVVQNWEKTTVEFLSFDINSQLSLSLIVAILFGVALDRLVIGLNRRRRR